MVIQTLGVPFSPRAIFEGTTLLLKRVYDDKDVQERITKSSGLDWTIAHLLTDSPATGRYRAVTASKDWWAGAGRATDRHHAASH